jgi:hypothetical protein
MNGREGMCPYAVKKCRGAGECRPSLPRGWLADSAGDT